MTAEPLADTRTRDSDVIGLTTVAPLSRRGFMTASAAVAAGYTLAAGPVRADVIKTDDAGLDTGDVKIKVADGEMPGYYARPKGVANPPVVIVAMEIFGLHEYIKDVTRRMAKLGVLAIAETRRQSAAGDAATPTMPPMPGMDHGGGAGHPMAMPMVNGEVDHVANGFDPSDTLTDFDGGTVTTLPGGQTQREFLITAYNRDIEIVPGLTFPAWTYNGRIPGPTIRVTEGDHVRITFVNAGDHPHGMHFHGIHPGAMDGVFDEASGASRRWRPGARGGRCRSGGWRSRPGRRRAPR